MKAKYIMLLAAFVCISLVSFGRGNYSASKDSIKVWGNCESCKNRIEKAATEAGATSADWNEDSKILVVSYDAAKTSNHKIQEKVAAVGHDTQDVQAPQGSYSKLPGCCKYERKASKPQAINIKSSNINSVNSNKG